MQILHLIAHVIYAFLTLGKKTLGSVAVKFLSALWYLLPGSAAEILNLHCSLDAQVKCK